MHLLPSLSLFPLPTHSLSLFFISVPPPLSLPPSLSLSPSLPPSLSPSLSLSHTDQESLTKELQSLPLRTDTLRLQRRRADLEARLAEVEDALRIFSRPKVFIKMEP